MYRPPKRIVRQVLPALAHEFTALSELADNRRTPRLFSLGAQDGPASLPEVHPKAPYQSLLRDRTLGRLHTFMNECKIDGN